MTSLALTTEDFTPENIGLLAKGYRGSVVLEYGRDRRDPTYDVKFVDIIEAAAFADSMPWFVHSEIAHGNAVTSLCESVILTVTVRNDKL